MKKAINDEPIREFMNKLKAERPDVEMNLYGSSEEALDPIYNCPRVETNPIKLSLDDPASGDNWAFIQVNGSVYYAEGRSMYRVWPMPDNALSLVHSIAIARAVPKSVEFQMDMINRQLMNLKQRGSKNN
jgi:hypothetical protein